MKHYSVIIVHRAKKQIDNLPSNIKARVADTILDVISKDPFIGKALKADLKGLYSYRVADYRIIYGIVKKKLIVQIIKVMHRREVYR